jgi:8-oxo-dGTP diphosphatase
VTSSTTEQNAKRSITVVGAVLLDGDRIFCTQRGPGSLDGYWEFPGGKIEGNETPEDALKREILEELACTIAVGDVIARTTHEYDFAFVTLTTYRCSLVSGTPTLSEHSDARWLLPSELDSVEWAPADLPTVNTLQTSHTV